MFGKEPLYSDRESRQNHWIAGYEGNAGRNKDQVDIPRKELRDLLPFIYQRMENRWYTLPYLLHKMVYEMVGSEGYIRTLIHVLSLVLRVQSS